MSLASDQDALVMDFMQSLTEEQVREANLHHRLHPEYGGTHAKPGEGLAWNELTEAQQQMLRRLWDIFLERRERMNAVRPSGAPSPPEPGPIDTGEIFGVGYAVTEDRDGVHTTLYATAQRYPVATYFQVRLPGIVSLPAGLQREGIDLRASGALRPGRFEGSND